MRRMRERRVKRLLGSEGGLEERTTYSHGLKSSSLLDMNMDKHRDESTKGPDQRNIVCRPLRRGHVVLRNSPILVISELNQTTLSGWTRGLVNLNYRSSMLHSCAQTNHVERAAWRRLLVLHEPVVLCVVYKRSHWTRTHLEGI